jgi:hypothetical protein
VLFVSVLQFVTDDDQAAALVRTFCDAVPAGSHVAISTITSTGQDEDKIKVITDAYRNSTAPAVLRTRAQIERLFGDLDLVTPGLVPAPAWHPDGRKDEPDGTSWVLAGVGRVG